MIDREKLENIENQLYAFNSQIVSALWIGLKSKPSEAHIHYLNKLLGETVKALREINELANNPF